MQTVQRSVLVPTARSRCSTSSTTSSAIASSCHGAAARKVIARSGRSGKTARIDIDFKGVTAHFTTNNVNKPPESITHCAEGRAVPALTAKWRSSTLAPDACKVEFDLVVRVRDAVLEVLVGPVFNHIAHHLHRRVRAARRRLRYAK